MVKLLLFLLLVARISLVNNLFSRENDDPLQSIDKVLSMSSCHRNSICHKGRIVSGSICPCPVITIIELSYPQFNGSRSLNVNDIRACMCGWHTCLSSVVSEALSAHCMY